jgi:prepilin-type N-terminal cleavage/methylation domain-containing protein/prepilin-type processing-associated H-X9-DG protein
MRLGFSIVELLVAIAILSLVLALTFAGVQKSRAAAARVSCHNNLRQLAIASQSSHAQAGHFPIGVSFPKNNLPYPNIPRNTPGVSWTKQLLGHIDQVSLSQQVNALYRSDPAIIDEQRHFQLAGTPIKVFRCPAESRSMGEVVVPAGMLAPSKLPPPWALTNFLGVMGTANNNGMMCYNQRVTSTDVKDGTSNTVLIGERPTPPNGESAAWYNAWGHLHALDSQLLPVSASYANRIPDRTICPKTEIDVFQVGRYDSGCNNYHFWSLHTGGAHFAFADGSVRFLSYAAVRVLPAIATRNGGETFSIE